MKAQAKRIIETISKNIKTDKFDKEKQVRLIMNVIAPDTYEKKFEELLELMFMEPEEGDHLEPGQKKVLDEDTMSIVVQQIFRKAQTEREYITIYGDLCERMTRQELLNMGNERISLRVLKDSKFRVALLSSCKRTFDEFLS